MFCSVLQCVAVCGGVSPLHTEPAAICTISAVCCVAVCCNVWQRVAVAHKDAAIRTISAVCCSVLWCSVLQCVAVCGSVSPLHTEPADINTISAVCCSVVHCVAACRRCTLNLQLFIQFPWGNRGMFLQCVAVCGSVLQCVAVCCSVLQCVAVYLKHELTIPSNINWLEYQWTDLNLKHQLTWISKLATPSCLKHQLTSHLKHKHT